MPEHRIPRELNLVEELRRITRGGEDIRSVNLTEDGWLALTVERIEHRDGDPS